MVGVTNSLDLFFGWYCVTKIEIMTVAHPLQMHWALSVCVLLVHTVKYYSPAKGNFGVCTKTLLPPLLPPKQTATIVNIWASLARSFLTIKIDGNWPLGIDLSSSMMDIPNTGCASKFWTSLQNLLKLPVLVKNGLILGLRLYLRKFFETQRR